MPEGPEIRRAADRIAAVLEGQLIEQAWFGLKRLQRFGPELSGARVDRVDTRGKALLVRFTNGLNLYAHNQLYGVWRVCPRGRPPETGRSLRVALHTSEHSALLYSASDIAVLTAAEELSHPFLAKLGPDLLDPDLTWRDLARRLNHERFRRRALASLYLDQGYVAGIGNYLRSEILFAAKLNPALRPAQLEVRERNALARATLTLGRRAYQTGGITLPERQVRQLKQLGLRRREYRFAVFDRAGDPCLQCGSTIARHEAGSRRIYHCPACQPAPHCAGS
jgi:endonuclease-8